MRDGHFLQSSAKHFLDSLKTPPPLTLIQVMKSPRKDISISLVASGWLILTALVASSAYSIGKQNHLLFFFKLRLSSVSNVSSCLNWPCTERTGRRLLTLYGCALPPLGMIPVTGEFGNHCAASPLCWLPRRTKEMKVPCGTSCPAILISVLPSWGLKVPSLPSRNWAKYTILPHGLSPPERGHDRGEGDGLQAEEWEGVWEGFGDVPL